MLLETQRRLPIDCSESGYSVFSEVLVSTISVDVPVEVISVSVVHMELVVLERFSEVLLSPDSVDVPVEHFRWLPIDYF